MKEEGSDKDECAGNNHRGRRMNVGMYSRWSETKVYKSNSNREARKGAKSSDMV